MSAVTVDVRDLPGRLAELLALAGGGADVFVRDGDATAKLVAAPPPATREWKFNLHPRAMVMREDFDDYIDEEAFLRGDIRPC